MYALVEELGQKENDLHAASDEEPRKKAHCIVPENLSETAISAKYIDMKNYVD